MQTQEFVVSKTTLHRLPVYYSILIQRRNEGDLYVSATKLAEMLSLNSVLVRKDLACISSSPGKPRVGFDINQIIEDLETFLGYNNYNEAILVGAGSLGRALLLYDHFQDYNINIIAAFDSNKDLFGDKINDKAILPPTKLKSIVQRMHVHIGIITVPKASAQSICDLMVESGITAIWNFAPVILNVPDHIIVRNENLASTLSTLIYEFKTRTLSRTNDAGDNEDDLNEQ